MSRCGRAFPLGPIDPIGPTSARVGWKGAARHTVAPVLWRKKTPETPAQDVHPDRPGAKNRPTPTRREAEAANRRPLVPVDRKAAARADRAARREANLAARQAMITGDEARMPARDRGPVRRYIRDFIDARLSLGELLLPAMVVSLALSLVQTSWALLTVFVLVYGLLGVSIIDAWLAWRKLKRQLVAKFGAAAIPGGSAWYAAMRIFQLRPLRMPRAQVARGQYPS